MKIMGWKHKFSEDVLEEGRMYFEDGDVDRLRLDDGVLKAVVFDGSEMHDVKITLNGNRVKVMCCSCNMDWDADACSHMAAVLNAYESMNGEDDESEDDEEYDIERADNLMDVIEHLTECQAKSILRHLAVANDEIRRSLMLRFSEKMEPDMVESVKVLLNDASDELCTDEWGILSGGTMEYASRIRDIMDAYVPRFLKSGLYWEAFEIALDALEGFGTNWMEEVTDGTRAICSCVGENWARILKVSDDETKNRILRRISNLEYDEFMNFAVRSYSFWFRNLLPEDRKYHEALFRERLAWFDDGDYERFMDSTNYAEAYEMTAEYVVGMFLKGFGTEEEMYSFIRNHADSKEADEKLLSYFEENGQKEKQLELLLEIINGSNEDRDQDELYSRKEMTGLISKAYGLILELKGKDEAVSFLVDEFFEKSWMSIFKEVVALKNDMPDEKWIECRKMLFQKVMSRKLSCDMRNQLLKFFIDEGEFEYAFKMLEILGFETSDFHKVAGKLVLIDMARTFRIHMKILLLQMKRASSRMAYRRVIGNLEQVESFYPDGNEKARKLVDAWKEKHGDRASMLDELSKAGY